MALAFDGVTKLVTISGTNSLDVKDLWSRYVDWLFTSDNSKYRLAMASVGGEEIDPSDGTKIPCYLFLLDGWRIRPREADHTLNVTNGVLLVDGGGDPFVNPAGTYVVRINYKNPLQAIVVTSGGGGGGGITVDDIMTDVRALTRDRYLDLQ
jgi:hypothetical protein